MSVLVLTRYFFSFSFPRTFKFTRILQLSFRFVYYALSFFPLCLVTETMRTFIPASLFLGVEKVLQVVNASAASDTRVTAMEIDHGVSSWSVVEYETRYAHTLYARRFGAKVSDGASSFMLIFETFARIRMMVLGIEDGCFCGDAAPEG